MKIRITGMIILVAVVCSQGAWADLIAHWDLEEGAGSTTAAAVGSPAADGEFVGWSWETSDLAPVAGGTTAAVRINGGGNGILLTSQPGPAGDTPRTVCAWIKADAVQSSNGVIVSWGHNANGQRYSFRLNASTGNGVVGALRLEVQGSYVTTTTPVNDGTWRHVAVVRDTGVKCHDVTLYVDGVAETAVSGKSGTNRDINTGTTFAVSIGNSAHSRGNYGFDGVIDDVRIYDRALSAEEIAAVINGGYAVDPSPASGAADVPVDAILSWNAPQDPNSPGVPLAGIVAHDVYIGTDEASVLQANVSTAGIFRGTNALDDTTYQPGVDDGDALAAGQIYYWRIDEVFAGDANTIKGEIWKFTTEADATALAIVEQPQSMGVLEGEEIMLSVVAANATGYQWFFNGGELAGQTGDTLVVPAAAVANEGSYMCRVSKGEESIDSDAAAVFVKRLMGHWKLEDSLVTELGDGLDGFLIGVGADPNFVEGIDGKAMELYGEGRIVEIADSNDVFNVYPRAITVSAWIKTTQAGYGAYVAKQDKVANPDVGFLLTHNGNSGIFNIRNMNAQPIVSSSRPVGDGNWHMVTGTYDNATGVARLYVDGAVDIERTGQDNLVGTNEVPLVFGAEDDAGQILYVGVLDDVRIWNYALDARDVAVIYNEISGNSACAGNPEYDFDGNCVVDIRDFAELAAEWMECNWMPVILCDE